MAIILDNVAAGRHGPERNNRLVDLGQSLLLTASSGRKQRQRFVAKPATLSNGVRTLVYRYTSAPAPASW